MLTALTLAFLLGQPGPPCASCGNQHASGGFPLTPTHPSFDRIWHVFHGELWGMQFNKCACDLGTPAPYGDAWAYHMHGGTSGPVVPPGPVSAPAPAPAPPPAPATAAPPATPAGSVPDPGAAPAPPVTPPATPVAPLP
jgi:hypothetical protein